FVNYIKIFALEVFNKGIDCAVQFGVIRSGLDDGGNGLESGSFGSAVTPFAANYFVGVTVGFNPNGLEYPPGSDAGSQFIQAISIKNSSWLVFVWSYLVEKQFCLA